jgi:hypothetical protein
MRRSNTALEEFAVKHNLPEADITTLASIRFRGEQPKTVERWEYIYRNVPQLQGKVIGAA